MFKYLDISTKDKLTIWFNSKNRKEFYYAPILRYKTSIVCVFDNNFQSIRLTNKQDNNKIYYSTQEIPNPYEEEFGTFLIRYLNADFSSFEKSYYTFFCYYGFSILKKSSENIPINTSFEFENIFFETYEPFFIKLKPLLNKIQKMYRMCVNYIYDLDDNSHIDYTTIEKFTSYVVQNNLFNYSKDINIFNLEQFSKKAFSLDPKYSNPKQIRQTLQLGTVDFENSPIYSSNSFNDLIFISLLECVKNKNLRIKKCQNCSKYFVSYKITEKYCNITYFPGEVTCKKKGATQFYTKRKQNVEWLKNYRNEYQRRLMQAKRINDTKLKEAFEKWKKEARNKINKYKNNEISKDELFEWLQK